ncbi:MAG: DNA polymerase III subunit gamma/tau [Clostridia bacterium]|nr:DNA polymerase III subunit gamma/tau [Clostridia bacterium]
MYRALYRKYRPRDFDDVCGQKQVTDILQYEVAEGKTSHAYLFCGSRGTGKTSCAKILAKAVNCENPKNGNPCNECAACRAIDAGIATDVIEMDAASNTGVDNVRGIKDEIVFTPAELRYRVYIIDEVHMMTGNAFNALLKTLEEPPSHVIFILATTELQKLPTTIVSRCQRFDFRRISTAVLVSRLEKIAAAEGISLDPEGARLIARMAMGGMRDAISLLELCAGSNQIIDAALVSKILGAGNRAAVEELVGAVLDRDYATIYDRVAQEVMSSRDLTVFFRDLLDYYRDLLVAKTTGNAKDYLDLTDDEATRLYAFAERFTISMLLYHAELLEAAQTEMTRVDSSRRTVVELTLTRMCEPKLSFTKESLLARLETLEGELERLKYSGNIKAEPIPMPKTEKIAPIKEDPKTPAPKIETPMPTVPPKIEAKQDGRPVYLRLPSWSEVVDKVTRERPSLNGFLGVAKAYRTEDRSAYLICTDSDFSAKMLSRPETEAALKLAIAGEEGRDISTAQFSILGNKANEAYTLVDEIAKALE